jgi:hypothetical protein
VSPGEWEKLAKVIQDRFPRENASTYFVKGRKEANMLQSGKLHGYYSNKRTELKRVGFFGAKKAVVSESSTLAGDGAMMNEEYYVQDFLVTEIQQCKFHMAFV